MVRIAVTQAARKTQAPQIRTLRNAFVRQIMHPLMAVALSLGLPVAILFGAGCGNCISVDRPEPAADGGCKESARPEIKTTVIKVEGNRPFDVRVIIPEGFKTKGITPQVSWVQCPTGIRFIEGPSIDEDGTVVVGQARASRNGEWNINIQLGKSDPSLSLSIIASGITNSTKPGRPKIVF